MKLKNETLNKEKQKELQVIEELYNKLEMEKKRLEYENQNYENDLQENQNELQAFNERFNRLEIENRRLETENQKHKDDLNEEQEKLQSCEHENRKNKNGLQEKVKAIEEQYNTFIKRELLVD